MHGGNIGALDVVFELGALLLKLVKGDLLILLILGIGISLKPGDKTLNECSPITRVIWSFLMPKPIATNLEEPQTTPSFSMDRTAFSSSAMSVSSSQGFTSRVTTD